MAQQQYTWADGPYKLLTTPSQYKDLKAHSAMVCAQDMADAHNCLLRGLNSIVLQSPHVPSSDQAGYKAEDVIDLGFYTESWAKMVDHHHHTEETTIFPKIEAMAGEPGLLSGAQAQHDEFHHGLEELQAYGARIQKDPASYRADKIKAIIDGFGGPLSKHLNEEIDLFLSFERLDNKGLRACWLEGEKAAKANGNISMLYDVFPVVLGCSDKTYEGHNEFPPLPGVIPYAIKYWFAKSHPGAWRFNPCDFWGQPQPLHFLPKAQKA